MKKIFLILTLALVALAGCKKDPAPEPDLPDTLQIADRTYEIGAACCYYSTGSGYTDYDLWFANKQLWNNEGNWLNPEDLDNANGFEVNVYRLSVKDATPGEIASGTYTYSAEYGSFVHDGRSDYGFYDENGNFNEYVFGQDDVEESELVIEVKHISGNIYEIKFTGGVDESGNPVSGYYKGEIDMFED